MSVVLRRGSLREHVLLCVCAEPEEWTSNELVDDLDVDRGEVSRAVTALRQRGLLKQSRPGQPLSPTPTALEWYLERLDPRLLAQPTAMAS